MPAAVYRLLATQEATRMRVIKCDRPGGCPRTQQGVPEDEGRKWFALTNVAQIEAATRGQAPAEVRHFCTSECLIEWTKARGQVEAWGPKQ